MKKRKKNEEMRTRSLSLRLDSGGRPASLDEESRSVEVVAATETPVPTFDWENYQQTQEILLMSGCRIPGSRQIVLLDTHSRWAAGDIVGSCRELRLEGQQLVGRAVFTSQPEGEGAFTKLREGHLTDFSIGYRVHAYTRVEAGKTAVVEGRDITGPALVATDWEPKELSICPIGADPNAKARGAGMEEENMNERMRKFLESRGLPADATDEQALDFLESLETRADPAQAQAPVESPVQVAPQQGGQPGDQVRAEETARVMEIIAMGRRFDCQDLAERLARDPAMTIDAARAAVLGHLEKTRTVEGLTASVDMGRTEADKFRAAMGDALALRCGLAIEKPAPGAQELRSLTLREACREALRMSGQPIPGNVVEMVGRALTTTDLPTLLGATARLSLMAGWEALEESYRVWVDDSGSVSDFKIHTMARAGEMDDLEEIPEMGEYSYGAQSETKETYQIVTYGKMFGISRQAIINDELGTMADIPRSHGEAAARKLGDIVYAVLHANAKMGDGVALFHSTHGNLMSAAAVGVESLGAAETAMSLQKDIRGKRRLNIRAEYLIAPVTKRTLITQFFATQLIGGVSNSPNLANPYFGGSRFQLVFEPRLDDASITTWYLAGPKGKTIRLFFLNGQKEPYLETKLGWNVDGVEYKVRADAGAKAVDWRGLLKNPGA